MARDFRMAGSGGWDVRGKATARNEGGKASTRVMFNDQELTLFLKDLRYEYADEFRQILKTATDDTANFLIQKGGRLRNTFRNDIYSNIANSIDIKEFKIGGAFGFRIYAAPEGQGPRGSRGVNLVGLVQDEIGPWDYGFETMTKGKYPVESSEVYGNRSGNWAFPILVKAGRPAQFPGIGTASFPVWDFTADAKKSIEYDTEQRIRDWLKSKFQIAKYRYRKSG